MNNLLLHNGHRQRLKERFLKSNNFELPDYEILELILCYANPRKDMKQSAKQLLSSYGSLASVINIDRNILEQLQGMGQSTIVLFKILKETAIRCSKAELDNKPIISSWKALIEYLRLSIGHSKIEMFKVIYLNKKNIIIEDEIVQKGTIDQVNVYPREILKKALFLDSSAVILVHNHPSGKARPSTNDIELTKTIQEVLKTLNILVHDHVIVTQKECFSFKAHGLI